MDKQIIIQAIVKKLEAESITLKNIADNALSEVTHGEMKQEGKYDTRSIEAGYLAGAQKRRYQQLKKDIESIQLIPINNTEEKTVSLGSLVELKKRKEFN